MNPERRGNRAVSTKKLTRNEVWDARQPERRAQEITSATSPIPDVVRHFFQKKAEFLSQRAQGLLSEEEAATEEQRFENNEGVMASLVYKELMTARRNGLLRPDVIQGLIEQQAISPDDISLDNLPDERFIKEHFGYIFDNNLPDSEEFVNEYLADRQDSLERVHEQLASTGREGRSMDANMIVYLADNLLLPTEIALKLVDGCSRIMSAEILETFPRCKEDYRGQVKKAMEEGWLSPPKNWEAILDQQNVSTVSRGIEDVKADGLYRSEAEEIFINPQISINPERLRHVIFHELTHALSGTVYVKRSENRASAKPTKIGLAHAQIKAEKHWLNEGITELVARRLSGQEHMGSYRREQEIVQELIDQGIDFKLFLQAYFESYDPEASQDGYSAFRELNKEILKRKGNGWLLKIQKKLYPDTQDSDVDRDESSDDVHQP